MKKILKSVQESLNKLVDWMTPYIQKFQDYYLKFMKSIQEYKYFNILMTIMIVVLVYLIIYYFNNYNNAKLCGEISAYLGY